ncbi:MAG TPA: S-layer homology domain-containing protein, partial [Acidimicrobiales bacterium]|nr:S-layer homology domain-containing protein [Acidimicrobiales bacterium]
MKRGGRVLAGFAAALLAVTLMPAIASATHGVHNAPRDIENACPPGSTTDHFDDDTGSTFHDEINCVAEYRIAVGGAGGRPSNEYSPGLPVSRAQMASFVMRKLDLVTGYTRPANSPDAFADDDGNTHEGNINDAAEEGIALGFQDGTFRPDSDVTRGQMASFIVREMTTAGAAIPTNPENAFPDAEGSAHHEDLNILHELGIYVGRTDGTSGFAEPINREQMAALLARNLSYLVEQGLMPPVDQLDPPTTNQSFAVAPAEAATNEVSDGTTTGANRGLRQYSVSGLDNATTYNIALFPPANISVDANGVVTFVDTDSNNLADGIGTTQTNNAVIEVVN